MIRASRCPRSGSVPVLDGGVFRGQGHLGLQGSSFRTPWLRLSYPVVRMENRQNPDAICRLLTVAAPATSGTPGTSSAGLEQAVVGEVGRRLRAGCDGARADETPDQTFRVGSASKGASRRWLCKKEIDATTRAKVAKAVWALCQRRLVMPCRVTIPPPIVATAPTLVSCFLFIPTA